jgi:hypothetical protein
VYSTFVSRFALDRDLLGTDAHLIVGDDYRWANLVPKDAWHLSGKVKVDNPKCLDTVVKIASAKLDVAPPERFVKAMSLFSGSLGESAVPWAKLMPAAEHQGYTKRLIEAVRVTMPTLPLEYFETVWCAGNAIIKSLQLAHVDRKMWEASIATGEGNVPALRSFEPDSMGWARPVVYDRFKTLTGRLTVERGPQILTLKREHRSFITSAYGKQGTVVALDFAALEARVLLYEYGRRCDDVDLYGMIAKDLGRDRKAIKGAVISELYGSSKWALGKHLGMEGRELDEFVSRVKAYFNTKELLARVKQQFVATGKVINRYGRPVSIDEPLDRIFISYYGQATGVDVTMMGFKQVVERLAKVAPRTRPLFLLHDALILDAHNDDLGEVAGIKHVRVKGYVQKFPLKYERLT